MSADTQVAMLETMRQASDPTVKAWAEAVLEHYRRARDLGWAPDPAMAKARAECASYLDGEVF